MTKLNDLEKVKIEAFCKDEAMYGAVRKVLLANIYSQGVVDEVEEDGEHNPLINGAFSLVALAPTNPIPNEELGAQLRAQWAGINALVSGFDKLQTIKSEGQPVLSPLENPGV